MKVLIVDDEPLARSRLCRLLAQQDDFEVVAEADNGERAIAQCNAHQPDVVLMDIRMPVMDGLVAATHLANGRHPPAVIFCTAYSDYALAAFDANAVDYLLKPVKREKLLAALAKAQQLTRVQVSAMQESNTKSRHLTATSNRGIELIAVDDVRYFLADHKYVTVYYVHRGELKEQLIDEPLKELEQQFGEVFVRIHRNALVAVNRIEGLEKTAEGPRVKLAGLSHGPLVSRRHLPAIKELLQHL